MAKTDDVLDGGEPRGSAALDGFYFGEVTKVVGAELWFVIPALAPDQELGPAPWEKQPRFTDHVPLMPGSETTQLLVAQHRHRMREDEEPPVGTRIAVGFEEGDADRPMVLAVYGWPE